MPAYWQRSRQTVSDQPAGELRHRVTFLRRVVTVVSGITKEQWEEAFTCWAAIDGVAGREYYAAAAVNREEELQFTIRFRRDVTRDMRILFENVRYDIRSIHDPLEKHVKLQIRTGSVTGDAN